MRNNCYTLLTLSALKEFSTAKIVTPTSANIAAHIVVTPIALRMSTATFMPIANTIFSFEIQSLLSNFHSCYNLGRFISHKDYIGCLNCGI